MSDDKTSVPTFSGLKKDYNTWTVGFPAKAKIKGYEEYLVGSKKLPTGTTDPRSKEVTYKVRGE